MHHSSVSATKEMRIKRLSDVIWQEESYDLPTFLGKFEYYFPLVVNVTEGYLGPDDLHTISSDTIYRISGTLTQRRMVVRDRNTENTFSIPLNYTRKFLVIPRRSDPEALKAFKQKFPEGKDHGFYLYEIKERLSYPDPTVSLVFQDHSSTSFYYGGECRDKANMGELEAMDIYDEKYLLGNSIIADHIYDKVATVPLYMSIKISIGISARPECGGLETWALLQRTFDEKATHFKYNTVSTNTEIMQFKDGDITGDDHDYDYIQPQGVIYDTAHEGGAAGEQCKTASELPGDMSEAPPDHPALKYCQETRIITAGCRKSLDRKLYPPPYKEYDKVMELKESEMKDGKKNPNKPIATYAKVHKERKEAGQAPPLPPRRATRRDTQEQQPSNIYLHPHNYANENLKHAMVSPIIRKDAAATPAKKSAGKEESSEDEDYEEVQVVSPACPVPVCPVPGRRMLYKTPQDIPQDMSKLTIQQVKSVLLVMNMEKYCDAFGEAQVDGQLLVSLNEGCLQQHFNMDVFEAKKVFRLIKGWRPNDQ